eukprot:CAMPEP_0116833392 /NCGR_PEP_ID=MMETSP0418-20121206/6410_1 /TAXON_ID=1158023 /ORGANISM="Astrosyne radiata, Strain 13vi08-1A" /LENGTH=563 /DNA_ID=CAMNT_0004462835 /DNA_START=257 /DNA_END=1948 /DNA_ORIENTATION=+
MHSLYESLTVSWNLGGMNFNQDSLLLALYCPSDAPHESFLEAATLPQVSATSQKHVGERSSSGNHPNEWFIPHFPITRHDSCQFRLFAKDNRRDDDEWEHLASSPTLQMLMATITPTNLHLAFARNPTEMVVQFTTAQRGTPVVQYALAVNAAALHQEKTSKKATGTSHTYQASDMCQAPANQTGPGKFQSPGQLHVVRLQDLEPLQTYSYKVGLAGGQGIVWSDEYTFTTAPPVGHDMRFSYLVYGDQGCPSVGWGRGGEWTSALMKSELNRRKNNDDSMIVAAHHFGDLSYARGAAHIWDEWFQMMQPIMTRIPLMISVGNHEYDHTSGGSNEKDPSGVQSDHGYMPKWGDYGDDSGGECGVPTAKRFVMPEAGGNGVFWYSHDYATVHTIVLSAEHNLTKGSRQYTWLEKDLRNVNRTLTPWVIMEMHRPLYESEFIPWERKVNAGLRRQVEDLLFHHDVDLILSGHYHAYLRSCDGLYQSKCNRGGPTYMTIGTAGAFLDPTLLVPTRWTKRFVRQHFGYGRITIHNASTLHFAFVRAGPENNPNTGNVEDEVWIHRRR